MTNSHTTPQPDTNAAAQSPAASRPAALPAAQKRAADVALARQGAGTVHRQEATGTALERRAETAAAAVAANAEAMAKARFFVALQRPRALDLVRERLLDACAVPEFAEECTWTLERWNSEKGKKEPITGFSVRFAEAVRQYLGNTDTDTQVIWDDDEKTIVQVVVTDLETNTTERAPVVVRKRKERRKLREGQVPIETRKGSNGQVLYIVAATDDEITEATNRAVAKAMRNAVLRLLRVDIKQECWEQIQATQEQAAKAAGSATKMLAKLAELGVTREQVEAWLGHAADRLSPDEWKQLGGIGAAIKGGDATWDEVMESRGKPTNYDVVPEIKEPAPAPAQESAEGAGPTKDGLIGEVIYLLEKCHMDFAELAPQIAKLCDGRAPAVLETCTKIQLVKAVGWLELQAKAIADADAAERGAGA